MFPNRDPRLPNAILNSPDNFLTRLADHELRLEQLEVQSTPPIEEIIGGRLTIADLILSPAEGVLIADPTSTDYTGSFMAGEGILFDSVYYVFGNVVNGELKTGFTDAGTLYAIDAEISGTVVVGAGSAGGWLINSTQIYSLASDIGIILDSSVPIIRVGNTAGDHIVIDGANQRIRSSNFVTGVTGLNLDTATGDAEFNNIVARGEMKTFLFTSQNQMAVAGNIMVSKDAGKLGADAASGDTTVDFGKSMTVGDWIKIQGPDAAGSAHTEWMLVGSLVSGTTYNVTRDVDGTGANNWLKDTPFVVIGAEGDSRIELVAGASASLQLITQGAVWNSQTVQASMSTVNGAVVAGGGNVQLSNSGITILEGDSGQSFLSFYDDTGATQLYSIKVSGGAMQTQSAQVGGSISHFLKLTDNSTSYTYWFEDADNQTHFQILGGAAGGILSLANRLVFTVNADESGRAAFGLDHYIDWLKTDGTGSATVYFNERGKDIDLIVKDDTDTVAFQVDAAAHTVSVYGVPITGGASSDGWNEVLDTWTRTGDHTFTVPTDVTATYRKGTKIRYKDGGAYEYGVVISSSYSAPNTTVNLLVNTDYAMAATTITDTYLSYIENPEGFPTEFSRTPSFTNLTVGNGTLTCKVKISGCSVQEHGELVFGNSTSVGSNVLIDLPVPMSGYGNSADRPMLGIANAFDDNAGTSYPSLLMALSTTSAGFRRQTTAAASVQQGTFTTTTPFTWATSDVLAWRMDYFM